MTGKHKTHAVLAAPGRGNSKFQSGFVLLILALSLALNLHTLAADSFWGDEIFTASFASRSPVEVIVWTARDIHPPLYYLASGAFTRLTVPLGATEFPTPASDWLWRFPSVIAVVLTVAVTYNLALHISRFTQYQQRTIATFAALLLCLAPIAIKYGQEARMHALFMFLSALSTWLLLRAIRRPRQGARWLAFALVTAANIYTMYFGFLILAAQAGLVLSSTIYNRQSLPQINNTQPYPAKSPAEGSGERSRRDPTPNTQYASLITHHSSLFTGFIASVALAFIIYAPWWSVLFNILRKRATVGAIEGGVGSPLDFMVGVVTALGPTPGPVAWAFLLLFLVGLIFLARHYRPLAIFGGLWLALPVALPIVLGDPRALQFRYAFVLPVYLTIIAFAIVTVSDLLRLNISPARQAKVSTYLIWLLATVSFIATLDIYNQVKPNWRNAATYLNERVAPADIVLIGPLWDEGRFIGYYYRGEAQLLTPAAMVANIEDRVKGLRAAGGQIWAVNRFAPIESPAFKNVVFSGVVISEPQIAVYEPALLIEATIDLAGQAVEAAYPWAARAEAQGVLNPDPRTAQAAALRAWGDALMAAGRPEDALEPYQMAVDIFPGWVNGFIALAEAYEATGNFPDAAVAYQQAVTFNLKWQGSEATEAKALIEVGNWTTALEKYHDIIDD